jgi:hypothetical protein
MVTLLLRVTGMVLLMPMLEQTERNGIDDMFK